MEFIKELLKEKQGFEFECISWVGENAISYASQGMKEFLLPEKDCYSWRWTNLEELKEIHINPRYNFKFFP